MNRLVLFLKDVKVELAKVSWPTREQTVKYSLAVIITSLAVALFLGGLDSVFSWVLNKFLLR